VFLCLFARARVKRTDADDGSMSQKERQKVVDKIKTDKETRIILMSFKAGGVGKLLPSGALRAGS
jgi:hypothetical protein